MKNIVDKNIDFEKNENERFDILKIQKAIIENIDNSDFRHRISPTNFEKLSESAFEKALNQLKSADINLSESEKNKLFLQTIEYYSNPLEGIELPIWHSTSSYVFRKSLEDGFEGGHGDYSGEHGYIKSARKINYAAQKSLSVSYVDHPAAEINQQMYAKVSSTRDDLRKFMPLDSESILGASLIKNLIDTLKKTDVAGLKQMLIRKKLGDKLTNEQVIEESLKISDEDVLGIELTKDNIDEMKNRTHAPNFNKVNEEILTNISDEHLKRSLTEEAQHPFPCFITFKANNLKENLTKYSRGKHEAHLPYEDHYWGNIPSSKIKEIRVPNNQIDKTRGWLKEKGLTDVRIIPLELFEIKRLIEENI